jgi:superfamily II DNA or RNA helicase
MLDRTERQKDGIDKWIEAKCRGTLQWATGTGKTRAGLMAITRFFDKNPDKKVVVIVPTEVLQRQWIKLLAEAGFIFNLDVLIINTAIKKPFNATLLVLDEAHRFGAPSFQQIFQMCNAPMVLGLTATFERLDGMHEAIAKHCPIVDTITVKEATLNGWLSEYKEYKVMIEVDDIDTYYDLNQQFLNHFAFFNFNFELAMSAVTDFNIRNRYAEQLVGTNDSQLLMNTRKEVAAHAFSWQRALKCRKDFVMNHPKKIEIAELILSHRPEAKAITFNSSIAQAEKFKNGFVVHSGNTKKKNRISLEEFSNVDIGIVHSSKMLTEGLDVKGLNLAIILHNTSSPTERIQKIGYVRPTLNS